MKLEYYLLFLVIIIALGIVVMINSQTTPGYSKVYFDNSTLPDYLVPNKTYTSIFIIESHEKDPKRYFFEIYVDDEIVQNGTVVVEPGKVAQILFNFSAKGEYERKVLENKTIIYNVNGVYDIVNEKTPNGVFIINGSYDSRNLYMPPSYQGPEDLEFLLNTSKNITIVQITEEIDNASSVVTKKKLTLIKMGKDEYKVIVQESKMMYLLKPVTVRIIVKTSSEKVYQIFRSFLIVGD